MCMSRIQLTCMSKNHDYNDDKLIAVFKKKFSGVFILCKKNKAYSQ